MNIKALMAAGLPLLASLAGASRDAYDDICPARDGQTETRGGSRVLFRCNRRLPVESLIDTLPAASPEACIEHCQSDVRCAGSQWLYGAGECRLYSVGDEAIGVARASLVIIVTRQGTGDASPGDGNSATLDECQTGLDDCTRSETRLQDELNACRASQGNAQEEASLRQELDTCENSRLSLQNQLRSCEASNDSLMTVVAVCPAKDGQSLRQGKGTFKFNCKSKRTGQAHKTTGHGFEMCLQACVKDAQCKATNYWWSKPASQRCEMLTGQVGYTGSTAEEHVVGAMVLTRH